MSPVLESRADRTRRGRVLDQFLVMAGSAALTLCCFFVLPLIQAISKGATPDLTLQSVDSAALPPPPPPMEEEPEPEPEPEDKPPELMEETAPLDLQSLELALNPMGAAGGWGGDFEVKLNTVGGGSDGADALFSLADLDQKPRAVYQPSPMIDAKARKKAPGTVYILFVVNKDGRVENPIVQKSTDPVFERPALAAVKKWKFEPGKKSGKAVRFRMRVPITFPKGK